MDQSDSTEKEPIRLAENGPIRFDRKWTNQRPAKSHLWIPSSQTVLLPCGVQAAWQLAAIFVVTAAWHVDKQAAFPAVASTLLRVAIIEADNFIFLSFLKSQIFLF